MCWLVLAILDWMMNFLSKLTTMNKPSYQMELHILKLKMKEKAAIAAIAVMGLVVGVG
jgi:hypothetical protein